MEPVGGAVPHEVEVLELDGTSLLDDRGCGAADGCHPVGELLGVADRGREADESRRVRRVDDDLLPHRPAVGVLQVVHFVQDDVAEVAQRVRRRVDHVAQDLSRHHDDGRFTIDRVVTREQTDSVGTVPAHEIRVLLVRQRFDRRRVERLRSFVQRPLHGVLGHDGLPRGRGCGDQDRRTSVDCVERPLLEVVEVEAVTGEERGAKAGGVDLGHAAAAALRARRLTASFPITIATS